MISSNRKFPWLLKLTVVICVLANTQVTDGISIPFFGSFRSSRQQLSPVMHKEQKESRIINADHGGSANSGALSSSSSATASLAGGNFLGPSPWISGTRDQFIRDQLVMLHPDSSLNRDAWKESGYLNTESSKDFSTNKVAGNYDQGMFPSARIPPTRFRKPMRKSKQQTAPSIQSETEGNASEAVKENQQNTVNSLQSSSVNSGSTYEFLPTPMTFNNFHGEFLPPSDDPAGLIIPAYEPILLPANNFLLPYTNPAPIFPYSPRTIHSTLPQDAVIQLLKSPEQELSPQTRPQVKLPFPLSHDCSANNGGASGSKPLQFVVLPIVEPVAPLKPIFPKPPFLSSQYGQFPYIPPFNYFNKKPPVFPTTNLDGSNSNSQQGTSGQSSGQFVPILNRPAPPLPFVFVQSLPLELIEHNMEMDVLNSSPSQTSESTINEVTPIAAPLPTPSSSTLQQQQSVASPSVVVENTRPLPLIVIEKVKTPGQPPSSPVAPAAAVVEISKQSLPKSGVGSGSSPLSTISVIKPITAPGKEPQTLEQQKEIHKTIEKLVPVAAAVLENVEQQQKQQKDGKEQVPGTSTESLLPSSEQATTSSSTVKPLEQEKMSSLRPSLRPDSQENSPQKAPEKTSESVSTTSEEIVGLAVNPTSMSEVEITEA